MAQLQRPPIVTIMGHVDHGKTSLLDKIRNTRVHEGEAGGITQAVGAYQAEYDKHRITFIDTPGHEAFTQMRARGGKTADIVVLVVAADDGIMPQTEEAINHIKASEAKMIIALNKVDLPSANPTKVKAQFSNFDIEIEEYGGSVPVVPTSAETGEGIDDLLQTILLVSSDLDLSAEEEGPAKAVVLESFLDDRKGSVIHAIVTQGTLNLRDAFIAGLIDGRVKSLLDWQGDRVESAGPSTPVEILGANDVPESGSFLEVVADVKVAQQLVQDRIREQTSPNQLSAVERLRQMLQSQQVKEIPLVLKVDTQGSLEAVLDSIKKLNTEEVTLKVIHSGVGRISENDVLLAVPVGALMLGFNVDIDKKALEIAKRERIITRSYEVIYHLLEELQDVVSGEIDAMSITVLGVARVLKLFTLSNGSLVAGSRVSSGTLKRNDKIRIIRDKEVIYEGRIKSLRKVKDEVGKVVEGEECGILLGDTQETAVLEGDTIEAIEA